MKKDNKGVLITFEGIDGSGHTTQTGISKEYLSPPCAMAGIEVISTREPGGTQFGEKVRGVILDPGERDAYSELMLFEAARRQLVNDVIEPALRRGDVVLCDRFTDSSLAYQCYGGGLPLGAVKRHNLEATKGITPDLTLLFDVDVETAAKHLAGTDYFERKGPEFFERVREGYLTLARMNPRRIVVVPRVQAVDARTSIRETFDNYVRPVVIEAVEDLIY